MTNYSTTFTNAINIVLKHEGGYVNDPDDPGGETKYGISKRSYPDVDITHLTREQAIEIYYRDWWVPSEYETFLPPTLAVKVFDTAINTGKKRAAKFLQRALRSNGQSIVDDGIIGTKTKSAIANCDELALLSAFRSEQAGYYRVLIAENSKFEKYKNGWLKRAYS